MDSNGKSRRRFKVRRFLCLHQRMTSMLLSGMARATALFAGACIVVDEKLLSGLQVSK
jgi:hypothetical protein